MIPSVRWFVFCSSLSVEFAELPVLCSNPPRLVVPPVLLSPAPRCLFSFAAKTISPSCFIFFGFEMSRCRRFTRRRWSEFVRHVRSAVVPVWFSAHECLQLVRIVEHWIVHWYSSYLLVFWVRKAAFQQGGDGECASSFWGCCCNTHKHTRGHAVRVCVASSTAAPLATWRGSLCSKFRSFCAVHLDTVGRVLEICSTQYARSEQSHY